MTETNQNLVCARCLAINRIPFSRMDDRPLCGKCKLQLLNEGPLELTNDNFDKFISRTSIPVIVDFWAPWCPPCRRMAPEFAAATTELTPEFILAKLNTEEFPESSAGFNISGIPCLIAFKNGSEVARQSGGMNSGQIVQWARSV